MINECIIIGGGVSINDGIALGLKDKIKNKFVITTNYSFKHFDSTFTTFIDKDFYVPDEAKDNSYTIKYLDQYEELKNLPLIIGTGKSNVDKWLLPNTIFLKENNSYQRERSLKNGFYTGNLTGIFSLTLATFLMNYEGIIFLLGFDWSMRNRKDVDPKKYNPTSTVNTHYYSREEIPHRGQGYLGYYENHNPDKLFSCFKECNLKIYNVSLQSNIETFEKISYQEMFDLLSPETINQTKLREEIIEKLKYI